ncbi:MAG: ABC transporter permease [Pseudomonadota bacterium]
MNLRDFRIGWRLLFKEPAYSAVVILGLAIGFAVCYLLLGLVRHSFAYDTHVANLDNIYRIKAHWNAPDAPPTWNNNSSLPARAGALSAGGDVMASAFITRKIDVKVGSNVQTIDITVVDPDFQKIFQLKVLKGDIHPALNRPDAIALTEETATKLFGDADAVGKTVQIGGAPYLVSAVVADQPAASTMPFASLTGINTAIWNAEYRQLVTTNWGSSHGPVYIKLGPGTPKSSVEEAIQRTFLASAYNKRQSPEQLALLNGKDAISFKLGPLAEAYLDPELGSNGPNHGDRRTVLGLAAVGLLILLLAATNYVNLATVRTLRRQREIAVRKVLGASAGAVSRQFLAESILVCLIATALGLLVAWLMLPIFSDLVQRKFDNMFSLPALLASLALSVLLGMAAGAYPTFSALKVRATSALSGRGNAETAGGLWMRRVLTVLQFATAMGLTGLTMAVAWQTRYASQLDPGFEATPLLIVPTSSDMRNANVSAFNDALRRIPGVSAVGISDAPVTINHNSTALQREGGSPIEISFFQVSPDFFSAYALKPLAGRMYSPDKDKPDDKDRIVVNAAGVRKFGFSSPQDAIGKFVGNPDGKGTPKQIIGVVPDIRHRSAHEEMQATVYFLSRRTGLFTVRSEAGMKSVETAVEQMWPTFFPNDVLNMKRVDTTFSENYADDLRLAKLLAVSSVIAIAIAAFGIYVLAAYSVQRRTREIVLRKLYGASGGAIGRLVAREFAVLIGAGALIGLPIAWIATGRYLAKFTEQAPIGMWAIGAALAVALVVALGSTLRHTLSAVRMAPALALRD